MVITYLNNDKVSVKTKTETVVLGDGVVIGQYAVPGAGEYDIASIQCEGTNIDKATVYFIRTEDLTIAFLSDVDASITKLDDANKSDILVIDVRSDGQADQVKSIIKAIEPSYVFLIGAGGHTEFASSLGLNPYESPTLKVSRSGLPLEGTFLVPRG